MKNLLIILSLCFSININCQNISPVIEVGKFFTGYKDVWGETIGIGLKSNFNKISVECNYIIAVYNQKEDDLLKTNTLFIDTDNTSYPFPNDAEFIRQLLQKNGYKTALGGIDRYTFKQVDLKLGYDVRFLKNFKFVPSLGLSVNWANVTYTNTTYDGFVTSPFAGGNNTLIPVKIVIPQIIRSFDYGWNYGFKLLFCGLGKLEFGLKFRDVYYKNSPFDNVSLSAICQYSF